MSFIASWAIAVVAAGAEAGEPQPPNIVVILTDDQGYADISFNPHHPKEVSTPHMDALAREGVFFTQAYISANVCSPTRAGLMTGRYQQRAGIYTAGEGGSGLPLGEKIFPQFLKPAGYICGAFGKWHLGLTREYSPAARGFDEFYGFLGRGAHDYFKLDDPDSPLYRGFERIKDKGYLTTRLTDEAVAFIRRHKARPFLVYLAYNAVHAPAQAPKEDIEGFDTGDPRRDILMAMLEHLDAGVGRVVQTLKKEGVWENTLLFFLTDNGGSRAMHAVNAPLRGFKQQNYEGGIRTPFIVSWPARFRGGRTLDTPIISLDVLPTALDAAGLVPPSESPFDGKSLLPVLDGKTKTLHDHLFWSEGGSSGEWAVRSGRWKLVTIRDQQELFDLAQDPSERSNLAAQEPDKVKELLRLYNDWLDRMAEPLKSGRKRWGEGRSTPGRKRRLERMPEGKDKPPEGMPANRADPPPERGALLDLRYVDLAAGPWQVRCLPGTGEFTFSMYGCPGTVRELQELVAVMKREGIGNGLDPGPTARAGSKPLLDHLASVGWPVVAYPGCADMQVDGGRCRLTEADRKVLEEFRAAGLFHGVQLGEWGYYFHNLSHVESWWRAVFGDDFEQFRHLMKPPGLKGYEERPADRRRCYEAVREYFMGRKRDLGGKIVSVTGHSHYEAYAAEWGADLVGLELGENIAFTQSKIAFARGAARQWRLPWSIQVSPWFAGSCTTSGPLRMEGRHARGLDAGHSLSFYTRMWLHGWFAGTAMVTPENSLAIFFEETSPSWKLTSHARRAVEVFAFLRRHDRGIPYTPVAIVLDHLAGYNAYQGRPWGILEPTPGDRETYDLFQHQLFPGSDHIHHRPDRDNPEGSYLRPTPLGEMFDVLLTSADAGTLQAYPVLLVVGDVSFTPDVVLSLQQALRAGTRLLLGSRHADALRDQLPALRAAGRVEVLSTWTNPRTGRTAAIADERLRRLNQELLPAAVEGDPVGYQMNRNRAGWVIELIHNGGVAKRPDRPAVIDPSAVARVTVRPRVPIQKATLWRLDGDGPLDLRAPIGIGPGETVYVELAVSQEP